MCNIIVIMTWSSLQLTNYIESEIKLPWRNANFSRNNAVALVGLRAAFICSWCSINCFDIRSSSSWYCLISNPFLTKKQLFHKKDSVISHFFYSVRAFAHIRQHYFSKYWWGRMHGPSPHLKFWGTVPPVPPRSPPLLQLVVVYTNLQNE